MAQAYAPDLDLRGVVAIAPAGELATLLGAAATVPQAFGFLVAVAAAWNASYPEATLESLLKPEAISLVDSVEKVCIAGVLLTYANPPPGGFLEASPNAIEPWKSLIEENTPGAVKTVAPIFIVQGGRDSLVPAVTTEALRMRLCARGDTVDLRSYPLDDHISILSGSAADVTRWTSDRLDGTGTDGSCAPR